MRKQTSLWTTREGKRLRICDMDDRHLLNAIALLERNAQRDLDKAVSLGYAVLCTLNGEMAQMCVEQDLDRLEETSPQDFLLDNFPLYEKLCVERDRRRLAQVINQG